MPDVFTKAKRSEVMSRIRSSGNAATELVLARMLRAHKILGWRRQMRVAVDGSWLRVDRQRPGSTSLRPPPQRGEGVRRRNCQPSTKGHRLTVRPDFIFLKSRTAVFVDGCFWHGCPKHATQPVGNRGFWKKKFARNQTRDRLVTRTLRAQGWRVLRIWEHELARKNEPRLLRRIQRSLVPLHKHNVKARLRSGRS